jgi:hypothetical protein
LAFFQAVHPVLEKEEEKKSSFTVEKSDKLQSGE